MTQQTNLQIIEADVFGTRDVFASVLTDKSIVFEAEAGFALQMLSASKFAMDTAIANRQSVIDAVTNVAAIGISLNPATKLAYLVPRDKKVCLDISYMGLMELAIASGSIRWAQAHLVYERDQFELAGYDKPPVHRFQPFEKDRGGVIGVYVVAKTADGDYLTHTMDAAKVMAIRDRSTAWKAYVADNSKKCPWVTDQGEMTKKTCVKQASKYWPKTERLDKAIHHLNTEAGEGLAELAGPSAPVPPAAAEWIDKAQATATREALEAVVKQGVPVFQKSRDMDGYRRFRAAVQAHGAKFNTTNKERVHA